MSNTKFQPGMRVKITDGDSVHKNRTGVIIKMGAASFPVSAYVELHPVRSNIKKQIPFVDTQKLQAL